MTVFELQASLTLDTSEYESGVRSASQSADTLKSNLASLASQQASAATTSKQYDSSIKQIDASLKTMASEMKAVTSAYGDNAKSAAALAAQNEILDSQSETLATKLDLIKSRLVEMDESGIDPASEGYQKLLGDLYETEAALNETEGAISSNAVAMQELESGGLSLTDVLSELADTSIGKLVPGLGSIGSVSLGSVAGVAALAGAAVELGKGLYEAAVNGAKYADDINTLSSTTGLSTQTLQEFKYMEDLIDVSLSTVSGSLRKLTNNMDSASKGTGDAAKAFEKLGVSVTDSNGNLRSTEDVFYDVIAALGEVGNQAERDALAMDIFGRSAQELNPMIDAGIEGLNKLKDAAHDAGYVLSDEQLGNLQGLQDSFDELGKSAEAFKNTLGEKVAPAIQIFTDKASEGLNTLTALLNDPKGTIEKIGDAFISGQSPMEAFFGGWKDGAEDAESATDDLNDSIENTPEAIAEAEAAAAEFAKAWQEAYENARDAAEKMFGTFEEAPSIVAGSAAEISASMAEMVSSLDSQTQYWNNYADNIKTAMERGVNEGLVQTLSDGKAESARILAELAAATDEEIANMNASYAAQQEAVNNYASTVADAETGVTTATEDMSAAAEEMESSVTASMSSAESAATTMAQNVKTELEGAASGAEIAGEMVGRGFAAGIRASTNAAVAAATSMASAVNNAIKTEAKIASPSKVAEEYGEFVGEGFAGGIENSEAEAISAAANMTSGVLGAFQDSVGGNTMFKVGRYAGESFVEGLETVDEKLDRLFGKITEEIQDVLDTGGWEFENVFNPYNTTWYDTAESRAWGLLDAMINYHDLPAQNMIISGLAQSEMKLGKVELRDAVNEYLRTVRGGDQTSTIDIEDGGLVVRGQKLGVASEVETLEQTAERLRTVTEGNMEEAAQWVYDQGVKQIEAQAKYYDMSVTEQYRAYSDLQSLFLEGSKQYFDAQENMAELGYKAIEEAQKDYVSSVKDFQSQVSGIYSQIDDLHAQYANAVSGRADALANAWGAFDEVRKSDEKIRAKDLISGLQSQVNALQEYSNVIDTLTERGASDALMEVVKDLGPTQIDTLQALARSSDAELSKIEELYAEKFRLANEQAVEEMEPLRESLNEQIEGLIGDLNRIYSEEAPNIVAAFDSAVSAVIGDNGLPEVEQAAIYAAQGIMRSIEDELGLAWNGQGFAMKSVSFADSAIGTATAASINAANGVGVASAASGGNTTVVLNVDGEEFARLELPHMIGVAAANGTPITSDINI